MDAVKFIVVLFMVKIFTNATVMVKLTSSSDKATASVDFTFTCTSNTIKGIQFKRDVTNECTIGGSYTNGTCVLIGGYNMNYKYTCDNKTGVYNVTIPKSYDIDTLHNSSWQCSAPVDRVSSSKIILFVNVPITNVDITTNPSDKNPIEIISKQNQLFSCKTNAGRPSSRIQWYISGTNITGAATPHADVCNAGCKGKLISSSELNYSGEIADNGKIIYCTASNINGKFIRSNNKSIIIWHSPALPSITQTPEGVVDEKEQITLTCEIMGGNPLANISWQCDRTSLVTTTDVPPTNKSISSVQLIASKDHNGQECTCTGSHPVWTETKTSSIVLQIRYAPMSTPEVTQMPSGPINEGTKVTLTCEISGGNPLPTIVWQCDEFTNITPTTTPPTDKAVNSIERIVTKGDDEKQCICILQHPLWTLNKEVKHSLNVYYSPIRSPMVYQTPPAPVNERTDIKLTCEIDGGKPLATINWRCNGSSNKTNSSTTNKAISSVQLTVTKDHDGKVCTCIGSHPAWKQNNTSEIRLVVRYVPSSIITITQTPHGPVVESDKVTITCEIFGGNPLATIAWECAGFTNTTSSGSQSTDKAEASVERVVTQLDNGRVCTCTGKHLLWTLAKTKTYTLNVFYPTTVDIKNTQPFVSVENQTTVLICTEADGNPRNASFLWYKSNTIIGNSSNYSIKEVKAKDAGNYICQGSNGFGRKSEANIEVHVLYSPKISAISALYGSIVSENGKAALQCNVQSNPSSQMEWMKQGSNATLDSTGNMFQRNFTIDNANCFDTSNYTCKATNTVNNANYTATKDIELFVNCSPRRYDRHEESPHIIGLEVGQNLRVSEHILAYPIFNITWIFKQDENSSKTIIQSNSNCSTYNIFVHQICLSRPNLTENDFGVYSAFIVNDIGNTTLNFVVTPQGKPYKSTNLNITCGILKSEISWKTAYNGGQEQQFYILTTNNNDLQMLYSTGQVGKRKGETKSYSLTMPEGLFSFDLFGNNSFGNTTVRGTSCKVQGLQEGNDSVIGLAAGLGSGMAVVFLSIVAVVIVCRKRISFNKDDDAKLFKRSEKKTIEEDNDELKDNPLYCSSDINSDGENGPVYSTVDKSKTTKGVEKPVAFRLGLQGPVYSEVNKTGKKALPKDKKVVTGKKMSKEEETGKLTSVIEMGNVYGNAQMTMQDNKEDSVYANAESKLDNRTNIGKVYIPKKNKDGLIYADLELNPSPSGKKFVIRGLENRTNYAIIDLNVKVDPLPSDDEDDDDEDKEKKTDEDTHQKDSVN